MAGARLNELRAYESDEAGKVLLDRLTSGMKMAADLNVPDGQGLLNNLLADMMAGVRRARAAGKVDQVFFDRYARVLLVTKLANVTLSDDPEGIQRPLLDREMSGFITDVTGQKFDMAAAGASAAIGRFSDAVAREIASLGVHWLQILKRKLGAAGLSRSSLVSSRGGRSTVPCPSRESARSIPAPSGAA